MNRVTVVQHVYHQSEDSGEPLTLTSAYGRMIFSNEEAYTRTVRIGTAEVPLDLGWVPVEKSSTLLLMNSGDKNAVEVLTGGVPFAVVYPGESARFSPHPEVRLTIRSVGGAGKLTIASIPK